MAIERPQDAQSQTSDAGRATDRAADRDTDRATDSAINHARAGSGDGFTDNVGPSRGQDVLTAINPATGDVLGHVPVTPPEEVPERYERARAAQSSWGALSVPERARRLRRLRFIVADKVDKIARRVAESTGKTEAEVLVTELLLVLGALQYVEKHGPRLLRRRRKPTPIFLAGKSSYIEYMPKGVVLVIAPWNFPLQLALVPAIYALAAGNAVILKPSEVTPMVGVLIEELIGQSGLPPDLVQVVHGAGELGAALVTPPGDSGPDHIFFTGSVPTGQIIQTAAAKRLIPTTLELSGKDAMIVFADAPLERAVNGAVWGSFMNSGQVCVGVERLYVERSIYDEFARRLAAETARLRQGGGDADGMPGADIGSMTFAPQVDIVQEHVRDAVERGATVLHAGNAGETASWDGVGDAGKTAARDGVGDAGKTAARDAVGDAGHSEGSGDSDGSDHSNETDDPDKPGPFHDSNAGAPEPSHSNQDQSNEPNPQRPGDRIGRGRDMFVPPIILGDVTDDMRVSREETFGPVISVIPFDTEQDVIKAVNESEFGLNASVWTKDRERGKRVASEIEAGGVAINDVIVTLANQYIPFGGVKQSGLGANHGETGLKTFSHEKAIMRNWLGRRRDVHWFPYGDKAPLFSDLLRNYFKESTNWARFLGAFVGLLRRSR